MSQESTSPVPASWPLYLLALLPKHALSKLLGFWARWRWPQPIQAWLNRGYVHLFQVEASEAEQPIESYVSIVDLFTRHLKPGLRPIDKQKDILVSPADGAWGQHGRVQDGQALQVKGRPYNIAALLGDDEDAQDFSHGTYATFYLSPRDYHRFHMPIDANLHRARYIPGRLWPVNARSIAHIDQVFARNERIICFFTSELGKMALVAVGATVVGRTVVEFDDLITNPWQRHIQERRYQDMAFSRGQELGRFEFGSTIILICENPNLQFSAATAGQSVKVGEQIAKLITAQEQQA